MFILLSLLSLAFSSADSLRHLDGRIIGGEAVLIEQYPSQVSLQSNKRHRCGGSVISENYILTAAHCVSGVNPKSLTIRAGSSYHAKEGTVYNVEEFHAHPQYNDNGVDYDIAIVKLKESLSFSEVIQPIGLPELNEDIPGGTESVTIGWGVVKQGSMSLPDQLQAVKVPIVPLKECRKAYGITVTERMICAGYPEGGKDACQGDSGGPLIVNGKVVGLTSWGRGCAKPKYPGVYASVPNLRKFVHEITGL